MSAIDNFIRSVKTKSLEFDVDWYFFDAALQLHPNEMRRHFPGFIKPRCAIHLLEILEDQGEVLRNISPVKLQRLFRRSFPEETIQEQDLLIQRIFDKCHSNS